MIDISALELGTWISYESVEKIVSVNRLNILGLISAIAGFIDSLYLGWLKITGNIAACSQIGDCDAVNNSPYAMIGDVPIAFIGALGYALIILVFYIEMRRPAWAESLNLALFGVTLAGTIYSAYLTYLEVAVIRAICPFCVLSAILMTFLFVLSIFRMRENFVSE